LHDCTLITSCEFAERAINIRVNNTRYGFFIKALDRYRNNNDIKVKSVMLYTKFLNT
jgi:hypothetical protein